MIVEASVEIAASAARLWETFADLSSWPRWNTVLRGVTYQGDGRLALGTTFRCTIQPFGLPISFEAVVTEARPPTHLVWETHKAGLTARHSFVCEEVDRRVRLISREQFRGPALRAAGPFFPAWRIRALTVALLRDLKAATEG
jgi:hypothetical protein